MRFRSSNTYVDVNTAEELQLTETELKEKYKIIGKTKEIKRINEWTTEIQWTTLVTQEGTQIKLKL